MTNTSTNGWVGRLLRVAALFWAGATVVLWLKPVEVAGQGGGFADCGSPAAPAGTGPLFTLTCDAALSSARILSLGTFAGSILLLLLASVFLTTWSRTAAVWKGALVVAPVAIPLIAIAVSGLFVTLGGTTSSGQLFTCGTALSPNKDPIAVSLCAGQVEARLVLGMAGAGVGILLLLAGRYIYRSAPDCVSVEVADPDATSI